METQLRNALNFVRITFVFSVGCCKQLSVIKWSGKPGKLLKPWILDRKESGRMTGRFDTGLFSRGVKRFTPFSYGTKNSYTKCFFCSRKNFTWSERNFCAFSQPEFVLKRLVSKRPVPGRTHLITQCRLLHRHHTTPPVVTMYRFCHTAKKSTEWAQNWNPTKLYLLNVSADYRRYTPRRMRSWNSWRVMYRL